MKVYNVELKTEYSSLCGGVLECLVMDYPWDGENTIGWRRPALIVVPGGAYAMTSKREGAPIASEFFARGFQTFVLEYVVAGEDGVPYPEQLLELAAAVDYVKKHSEELHVNPDEVFAVGFSAGGHLAAATAVGALQKSGDKSHRATLRPDFAVLFYPVITGDEHFTHKGSFDNLLGGNRTAELTDGYSLEKLVSNQTPPTFMALSDDDGGVPPANSIRFYNAMKAHGRPASMHIYPSGGHGWGFRDSFKYKAQWQTALLSWLEGVR